MGRTTPKIAPAHGDLDFIQYMVFWTHKSQFTNSISIGSAVFARLTCVPNTQTH